MKKLLIAVTMAGAALSAQAENFYVQGDLGYSIMDGEMYNHNVVEDKVFDQRISLGYDFGRVRLAADYSNFGKAKDVYYRNNDKRYPIDISLQVQSVGVTAFYDFTAFSKHTPYIGLRASQNRVKGKGYANNSSQTRTENRTGFGVLAGTQYPFNDRLSLNVGAEYNRLGNDVYQIGGKVGLRFDF